MNTTRYSRQREAIIGNLRSRYDHPTAEMVYETLRHTYPNISLGTVYRNLSLLESQGEVIRLHGQDTPDRYDGDPKPHEHLHCRACGAVTDIKEFRDLLDIGELRKALTDGSVLESYTIAFRGMCAACSGDTYGLRQAMRLMTS